MWSHYAERHRGICLGFNIPESSLDAVRYLRRRPSIDAIDLINAEDRQVQMKSLLCTKYSHWKYEQEIRAYVQLSQMEKEGSLYYLPFSETVKLCEVIVGAEATLTRDHIHAALGDLGEGVSVKKARIAFRSFRVVTQRNVSLWQ
jgi:hypothetical protein